MFAKKNLIAVAALATLAVSAQAQSSVTLYGNLDVGLAHTKSKQSDNDGFKQSGSTTAVESSLLTESYFGLKGQEDLGGGLKAIFKLEAPVAVDTGATNGNMFNKNAYVGVAGDFGTLKLGNQESLFKTEAGAFDAFGVSPALAGSARFLRGLGQGPELGFFFEGFPGPIATTTTGVGLGGSWSNSIGYTSPNFNGLTVSAQYSAKEGADFGGAYAIAANYTSGALGLSAVYGQVKQSASETINDGDILTFNQNAKSRAFLLGASYDFGVVKAFAQYGRDKITSEETFLDDGVVVGGDKFSATPKFYNIGVVAPVTQAGAVHASYGQVKESDAGYEYKERVFSLAYHHTLSKRTGVYAGVNYTKATDKEDGYKFTDKGTTLAVGLRHAF